jgi:hypothetical protein
MAAVKIRPISSLVNIIAWLTGVLVSLAVGFGMVDGTLRIRWLSDIGAPIVTVIAGWIVIVLTLLGVILAIASKL